MSELRQRAVAARGGGEGSKTGSTRLAAPPASPRAGDPTQLCTEIPNTCSGKCDRILALFAELFVSIWAVVCAAALLLVSPSAWFGRKGTTVGGQRKITTLLGSAAQNVGADGYPLALEQVNEAVDLIDKDANCPPSLRTKALGLRALVLATMERYPEALVDFTALHDADPEVGACDLGCKWPGHHAGNGDG
jgi:hypothetical protein